MNVQTIIPGRATFIEVETLTLKMAAPVHEDKPMEDIQR
jgi:hypothetical protein